MIRFLQKDNRVVKALFIVIIGAAVLTMVITLIPGIFQDQAAGTDAYATVYPHWYSKVLLTGQKVTMQKVQALAQRQMQSQRYPDFYLPFLLQRAGQQLVTQQVLVAEAGILGIHVTDADLQAFLHTGQYGEVLFPKGEFIGVEKYQNLIQNQLQMSTADFEDALKQEIAVNRLRQLVTGAVSVSDNEARDTYRNQNVKIKFDYAVISSDDVKKQINPTDAELQDFFKKNAARYARAVPEQREIRYFAFTSSEVPGGAPQVSPQEIQAYYTAHQADYKVDEEVKARHILISVAPGADAKTDAAAKAKAEGILKQIQAGGDFAALAKANSGDPGSKDTGGELGFMKRGATVPEFDKALFSMKPGETQLVRTAQFGYHILQVEAVQTAHTQPLNEVLPSIQATLLRQKTAEAQQSYAQALAAEAAKSGLDKTAEAHHLHVETTPFLGAQGVIAALPDSTQVLQKAFAAKQGAAPEFAQTGEGYAIFQVAAIQAPHPPDFAGYKDHIADDYRAEKLPQLLAQKTQELAAKAKNLNDLAKAAKEVGATVKTSDLVNDQAQVPDMGQIAQVAPDLLKLPVGGISGPISTARTGVVAEIVQKQEPTPEEIAKNLDQTRDQLLEQRRDETFNIFVGALEDKFKKAKLIQVNAKAAKSMNPAA